MSHLERRITHQHLDPAEFGSGTVDHRPALSRLGQVAAPHPAYAAGEPETVDEPPPDRDYPYAFAEDHDRASDLAADLPRLRAEIALLEAAGVRSPAAMYAVPNEALGEPYEATREAVITIAMSAQAVQVLQLDSTTDKAGVLDALVGTARHNERDLIRLSAADTENRAHSATFGALAVVDDDGSITFDQLRPLIEEAERTNSKLLLIVDADVSPPIAVRKMLLETPWKEDK